MAITICKKCGKKVSDTVDFCIHCGANIKESRELCNDKQILNLDFCDTIEAKESEENNQDFSFFSPDEQLELEREFLTCDKWAKKYQLIKTELPEFSRTSFFAFVGVYFIAGFGYKLFSQLPMSFTSTTARDTFLFFMLSLAALWVISVIFSVAIKIRFRTISAKAAYLKKFQKWLKENKSTNYYPTFFNEKEQIEFEQVDINLSIYKGDRLWL